MGIFLLAAISGCGNSDSKGSAVASLAPERAAPSSAMPTPSLNASVPAAVKKFRSARKAPKIGEPQRLRIPTLHVDSALEKLGRQADDKVEVPRDWQSAGWYREGPRPGEAGSAVILGHVDSPQGDAVFTGLADVKAGTPIHVDTADGSTVTFRVTRVEEHLQADFPTDLVYLATLDRELRLITCGGDYIKARGGYQSNVIVFATAD